MNDRIQQLKIIEAAIFAAGEPISAERLTSLFEEATRPSIKEIKEFIAELAAQYSEHGIELTEVASGYRFQAKSEFAINLQRLWEKKPPRYSRALLETLAIVIYRQPISRGEIEDIRGVAVSTTIMKTLLDHNWVKIVGYKEVPGKPALYGSTKQFLDYFNLKSLNDLPELPDITNLDALEEKLEGQLSLNIDENNAVHDEDHKMLQDETLVESNNSEQEILTAEEDITT